MVLQKAAALYRHCTLPEKYPSVHSRAPHSLILEANVLKFLFAACLVIKKLVCSIIRKNAATERKRIAYFTQILLLPSFIFM